LAVLFVPLLPGLASLVAQAMVARYEIDPALALDPAFAERLIS
jgi:hypothetical protein